MTRRKYFTLLCGFIVIVILIVLLASKAGKAASAQSPVPSATTEGVAYLQALEEKNPQTVADTLKVFREQKMQEMRDEYLQTLESDADSVWSFFDDYVLLGDSSTMGFDFYEFLDKNRVMAEKGDSILTIREHIPEIVEMNPSYLYISYGANDIGSGIWATAEEYAADLSAIIQDIQAELPEVTVFVNSILLAYEPAYYSSSAWYDIPEYNNALAQMCSTLPNCHYIDNTTLCETYSHLYEGDGIHVMAPFYSHWAANMLLAQFDLQLADS